MKKRILSFLMALCLLSGNCLTVFAEEAEPVSLESTADIVTAEAQEQPQTLQEEASSALPRTDVSVQEDSVPPVLNQDTLAVDMDRQYPGMDKTYSAGYSGTISDGKLRLVLPLLNQGGLSSPINVTISAAFLTVDEKKESILSQNMDLGNGQTVENVYLADFEISLPGSVAPGSYPVKVTVDIGDLTQAIELPASLNVVIPQPETPSTQPTNPTAPTQPEAPTEPSLPQIPTVLEIDSSHIYSGMDMAYEDGYLPRISGEVMTIVLPLTCSGVLWGDKLDTSIALDTSANSPFVVENFRKTFFLESVTPKNSSDPQDVYALAAQKLPKEDNIRLLFRLRKTEDLVGAVKALKKLGVSVSYDEALPERWKLTQQQIYQTFLSALVLLLCSAVQMMGQHRREQTEALSERQALVLSGLEARQPLWIFPLRTFFADLFSLLVAIAVAGIMGSISLIGLLAGGIGCAVHLGIVM